MPSSKDALFSLHKLIGTGLYTGYVPIAPGTAGSALCAVLLWIVPELHPLVMIFLIVPVVLIGIQSASVLEETLGRDPAQVTIDEFAGMMIALFCLPKIWWLWMFSFFLFRALDIYKPQPIRYLEYLPGGLGIMADDIMAGIYTNAACWILIWIT